MLVLAHQVAIGICTHNDVRTLPMLLRSLEVIFQRSYNHGDYNYSELIIVSSGSDDGTNEIINSYRSRFKDIISYKPFFQSTRKGKASAVNLILEENTSDYLIFIPADVYVCYNSLKRLIHKISNNPLLGAVSGRPVPIISPVKNRGLKRALNVIWNLHNETLKDLSNKGKNSHSSGELMIIKSKTVKSIPGDIINDDAYLAVKIKSMGFIVSYEPHSKVSIEVPHTVNDYIIQRKRILIGHKQLSNSGKDPTNFRTILRASPLLGIKLILRSIRKLEDFIGLLHAIMLEMKVELSIRAEKINTGKISRNMIIWSRVNKSQVSND